MLAEDVTLHGRRFTLLIEGPDEARRYSVYIRDIATGRLLTRNPVRGRSPDDARDRALEVMQNLVGIERLQEEFIIIASELAPGAFVELSEDAHAVRAELIGPWELAVPFAVSRDEVADPDLGLDELRDRIRMHLQHHLRPGTP